MRSLESFHFRLHHESGGLELLPGLVVEEVSGNVINPDQVSVSFTGTYGAAYAIRAALITLGEDSYMTNPLTGQWQAWDTGVSPLGFFSPSRGIASMMEQVVQIHQLKNGETKPAPYRFGGTLAAEALASLLGVTLDGAVVQVELTIDTIDLYLLQAKISGRVIQTDVENVVRVITLSAFDEPVAIEAPL